MKARISIPVILIALLLSYLVTATRIFYPFHRLMALILMGISVVFMGVTILVKWKQLRQHKQSITKSLLALIPYLIIAKVLITIGYAAFVLTPLEETHLLAMSDRAIQDEIRQDIYTVSQISNGLESIQHQFDRDSLFHDQVFLNQPIHDDLAALWMSYMTHMIDLDVIKNKYKGFYQLDYNLKPHLHADAFFVALSAFLTQHESILTLVRFENNHLSASYLDAETDAYGADSYFKIKQWVTNPDVLLQLSAASAYYYIVKKDFTIPDSTQDRLSDQMQYVFELLGSQPGLFIKNPLDYFERSVNQSWLPIQETAVSQINRVQQTGKSQMISPQLLRRIKPLLMPGDIILTRINWKPVHLGLPGFWRHASMVIGPEQLLDSLDFTVSDTQIKLPIDQTGIYLIETGPDCVQFQILNQMQEPDFITVLRPRIGQKEKRAALQWALQHLGTPDDNDLDFTSDNFLMSSELICKAYNHVTEISWHPTLSQGRLMFSPNDFVKAFDMAYQTNDQSIDLVFYWERAASNQVRSESESLGRFRSTWIRPKWSLLH
ncbi:hypothetical protein HQ585_01465 [candidate division KSB1 bacterium]|nr:hypothetical protein [candidate division KSB1 bacterium]